MCESPTVYRVYLAGPLFSISERMTNRALAAKIMAQQKNIQVILPQDYECHAETDSEEFFEEVFESCKRGVEEADALVAILDGSDADSGTCWEVGYAVGKGVPVIGIRTDYRQNQEKGLNLMLSRCCKAVIHRPAFDENVESLARDIVKAMRKTLKFEDVKA